MGLFSFLKKRKKVAPGKLAGGGLADSNSLADGNSLADNNSSASSPVEANVSAAPQNAQQGKKTKTSSSPLQPPPNDLEAEFLGTYHLGRAIRQSQKREWFFMALAAGFALLYFCFPRTVTENHYFGTEPNGSLMPMVAFNQPFDSRSAVISWTENAITGIFDFDAQDYRRRMESSEKYFTTHSFDRFLRNFKKNGLYADMMDRKLMIDVVPDGVSVIRQQGLVNGVYSWQVQMPLQLRLENSNGLNSKRAIATVLVQRVANSKNPDAIAITSIALTEVN
ncbi:DotI/IcmL family type IV secretion protein [Acidithiobacillus thiooxidans]|uniref:DotI/IcmL family type IV secretion protein n=1 Tax=Acidithiobacillus thiooxidans TaxID=930 RepID=UPI00356332B7|nr:DotI/IcmL family type IV secretion protein [Acidithiobacillus sp.]